MPRCAMSRPCTENCLTNPSSSGRTYHEHGRSFPIQKSARPKMGQVSVAWGTFAKLNMMLRRKNARCLRNRALSPRNNREQGALSMTLSQ
jgi:hypothetical protein